MTAGDWTIIIGAVFLGATQCLNIWITYLKGRDAAAAAKDAAVAAHDAKNAADDAATVSSVQLTQSRKNAEKLEEVHTAVNSGAAAALEVQRTLGQAEGRDQQRAADHPERS